MARLNSRTGCRTCLLRKKKCDEVKPVCGGCERLGLRCVSRKPASGPATAPTWRWSAPVSAPPPQVALSNGYAPFGSAFEKQLVLESPTIFHPLLGRLSDPGFRDFALFGRLCMHDLLVREALVAFSSYIQGARCAEACTLSLRSYQGSVVRLKQSRAYEDHSPSKQDVTITAVLFLGLLEGLGLGDSVNCIAHFGMCQRLLTSRLAQPAALDDPSLAHLYRIVAECILYNLATLSPFHADVGTVSTDWGESFDCLFPRNSTQLSPFCGGFQRVYLVMYRTNVLLRQVVHRSERAEDAFTAGVPDKTFTNLWKEIDQLEKQLPSLFEARQERDPVVSLYQAIHSVSLFAVKIHLTKVHRLSANPSDDDIRYFFLQALVVLKEQDVLLPGNPSLRWPLTILACAADMEEDFDFIASKMKEVERIIDPANSQKLSYACNIIQGFRQGVPEHIKPSHQVGSRSAVPLDFLLEPRDLDKIEYEDQG